MLRNRDHEREAIVRGNSLNFMHCGTCGGVVLMLFTFYIYMLLLLAVLRILLLLPYHPSHQLAFYYN